MSTEPERPIERELRRYARWRREQYRVSATFPESARHRLHAEIERAQGNEAGAPERPSLNLWIRLVWPRLVLATGVCGVILAIGIALNQNHNGEETSYAQAERNAQEQPVDSSTAGDSPRHLPLPMAEPGQSPITPSPEARSRDATPMRKLPLVTSIPNRFQLQPAGESSVTADIDNAPIKAPKVEQERSAPVAKPLAQTTRSLVLEEPESRSDSPALDQDSESEVPASAAALAVASVKPDVESNPVPSQLPPYQISPTAVRRTVSDLKMAGAERQATRGVSYQRIRRARVNFNSPALPKVLASFHFIREGETVELVDVDGSVYRGTLVAPAPTVSSPTSGSSVTSASAASRGSMQRRYGLPAPAPEQTIASPPSIPFSVKGTNITLGLPVTFVGNLQEDAVHRSGSSSSPEPSADASAGSITGQVTLGDGTRFEVIAEPNR